MKKIRLDEKGITLIEILVTLALLGLIALVFLSLFSSGFSWVFDAGYKNIDNFDAQSQLERKMIEKQTDNSDSFEAEFETIGTISVEGGTSTSGSFATFVPGGTPPDEVAVSGINLNTGFITLAINDERVLSAVISPTNASNKNVTWSSDAPSIASVDSAGKVTAVSWGNATVTVTTEEGNFTDTCLVEVTAEVLYSDTVSGDVFSIDGTLYNKTPDGRLLRFFGLPGGEKWTDAKTTASTYYTGLPVELQAFNSTLMTQAEANALGLAIRANNSDWWTFDSASGNNAVYVMTDGTISTRNKNNSMKVRPVVEVSGNPSFHGQGTIESPYLLIY